MKSTTQQIIKEILNNPANSFSSSTKDLLETIAKQTDIYKYKADKWDKLDDKISKFYPDDPDINNEYDEYDDGLIGIGEAAAIAFGYL